MIMTSGYSIILCPVVECSLDLTPQPLLAPLCLYTMTLSPESWSKPLQLLNNLIKDWQKSNF